MIMASEGAVPLVVSFILVGNVAVGKDCLDREVDLVRIGECGRQVEAGKVAVDTDHAAAMLAEI